MKLLGVQTYSGQGFRNVFIYSLSRVSVANLMLEVNVPSMNIFQPRVTFWTYVHSCMESVEKFHAFELSLLCFEPLLCGPWISMITSGSGLLFSYSKIPDYYVCLNFRSFGNRSRSRYWFLAKKWQKPVGFCQFFNFIMFKFVLAIMYKNRFLEIS